MKITRVQLKNLIENLMHEDVILDDAGNPVKYKSQKLGKTDDMSKDFTTLKGNLVRSDGRKLMSKIADSIPYSYWKGSELQKSKSISLSGSDKNKNKAFEKEIDNYLKSHGLKSENDIITISIKKLMKYFKHIKNSNYNLFKKDSIVNVGEFGKLKDREIILVFGESKNVPINKGMSAAAELARLDALRKIDEKFGGPFTGGKYGKVLEQDYLDSLGIAMPINFIYTQDKKLGYMFAGVYAIPTVYLVMLLFEKIRPDLIKSPETDSKIYNPKDIV